MIAASAAVMPIIKAGNATVHDTHGVKFVSYVRPSVGSSELCGWRIEIPGRSEGVPHQVSKEEVIYVLDGTVSVRLDDACHEASAGDVIVVPANSRVAVDNPASEPLTAWVTTSVGFLGTMPDGSSFSPPWTQ